MRRARELRGPAGGERACGAHGRPCDIGYTIPGRSWTYRHLGPGPGPDYLDYSRGRDRAHRTGRATAADLEGTARALAAIPLGAPPR